MPLHHYKLNGNTNDDGSAFPSITGQEQGNAAYTYRDGYYYADFNGGADFITFGNNGEGVASFTTEDFSLSFWLKPGSSQVENAKVMGTMRGDNGQGHGWAFSTDGASNTWYHFVSYQGSGYGGGFRSSSPVELTPDVWQHVAIVRVGGTIDFYVDGTLSVSDPGGSNSGVATDLGNPDGTYDPGSNHQGRFNLGTVAENVWGGAWVGGINDFRAYDGSLSAAQISELHSNGHYFSKKYTSLIGRADPTPEYALPDPNAGWALLLNSGHVYTSPTGLEGTWSSTSIPSYAANSNQKITPPGTLHKVAGFWFTRKPKGVELGDGQQLAWANALDSNGNAVLPTGWQTTGPFDADVASIHPDYARNVALLTRFSDGGGVWTNSIWVSNQASTSSASPTWTKINDNATSFDKEILGGHRITSSACNATTHVFVSKDENAQNEWGSQHIHYWNHGSQVDYASDVWNLQAATVPNFAQHISKPVYSQTLDKWFAGYYGGVLMSSDGGATWAATALIHDSGHGPYETRIYDVAVGPTGTVVAVGPTIQGTGQVGVVYRSADGGSSWQAVAQNDYWITSVSAADVEGIFLFGGAEGVLGISTSDALAVSNVDDIVDNMPVGFNPDVAGMIYAGLG